MLLFTTGAVFLSSAAILVLSKITHLISFKFFELFTSTKLKNLFSRILFYGVSYQLNNGFFFFYFATHEVFKMDVGLPSGTFSRIILSLPRLQEEEEILELCGFKAPTVPAAGIYESQRQFSYYSLYYLCSNSLFSYFPFS